MHDSPAPGVYPPGAQPPGAQPPGAQPPGTQPPGAPPPEERGGDAARGEAGQGGAPRAATIVLTVSLVLVVVLTGVLATVAVLMTRNPDAPLLSGVAVRRLQTPMHFAPVKAVKQAPCPGVEAVLDEAGTTCYQVEAGVTVTTVQKIETLRERNGAYSVRIVLSPQSRGPIADLTRETVERQLALVVGDRVVTAPRVTQAITQDSLSIAGFTKESADALVMRLLGTAPGTAPPTAPGTEQGTEQGTAPPTAPGTASPPAGTDLGTPPATPDPTPAGSGSTPPATAPGTQPTGGGDPASGTGGAGAAAAGGSPRFDSCRQAVANGYGPYTRGWHPEYDWYADGDTDHDGVACDPQDLAA